MRIVKAWQEGRRRKVKALQWMLTCSLGGKALAVRRVTETKANGHPAWTARRGRRRKPNLRRCCRSEGVAIKLKRTLGRSAGDLFISLMALSV
jgi:hypothetical protein